MYCIRKKIRIVWDGPNKLVPDIFPKAYCSEKLIQIRKNGLYFSKLKSYVYNNVRFEFKPC